MKAPLLSSSAVRVGFLLHVAWALVAIALPLVDGLGFERALSTGLLAAVTGAAIGGVAGARDGSPGTLGAALGVSAATTLPSALVGLAVEWVGPTCSPSQGAQFFLLLAVGDALIGAALGFAGGRLLGRPRLAVLATLLVHVGFVGWELVELATEPQVSVHVIGLGFWPGPIYDEALAPDPALWVYRAAGLGLLGAPALLACGARSALPAGLSLALGAWAYLGGAGLGFGLTREDVESELARVVRTEHFELHVDPRFDESEVASLIAEHELAFARLERFFEAAPPAPVRSYVYADAAQKGALIGAARTQVAKPWLKEIHIHGARRPHPVLGHELAHVFAAELTGDWLGVPTSLLLVPRMGLVEGIAVASEEDDGELSLEAWAAAMKQLDLLPDVATLLSPTGFYALASSRAYTASGAFVRWLVESYGIERFGRIYDGDAFEEVYPSRLDELVDAWEAGLGNVRLTPSQLRIAEQRFERPSIWNEVCARSAALDRQTGYRWLRAKNLEKSRPLLERVQARQPADIAPLVDLAWEAMRRGRIEPARRWIERAQTSSAATVAARAAAIEARGALAWAQGDLATARRAFSRVLEIGPSTAMDRLQTARLAALEREEPVRAWLRAYLSRELVSEAALANLLVAAEAAPDDPLVAYLLGLRLEAAEAWSQADAELARAEPLPPLLDEARTLARGRVAARAGRIADAERWLSRTASVAARRVHRVTAQAWLRRARFAAERE